MSSYTATDRATALRLLKTTPRKDVAAIIGCRIETISRWAREAGIELKQGRPWATTPEQRKAIRRLRRQKLSMRAIGRVMNLHPTTVLRTLRMTE